MMLTWKTRRDGCEFADTGGHGRYTIHPMRDDPGKLVLNLDGEFIGTFSTSEAAKARAQLGRNEAFFAGQAS